MLALKNLTPIDYI